MIAGCLYGDGRPLYNGGTEMKLVAVVGMAGAGKTEVARLFCAGGFARVRFGDITDEMVKSRGLPLSEENERRVREELRREHGMAAYAILNQPRIDAALEDGNVVVDGLYSWEEYLYFKEHYRQAFLVVAVTASPRTRYARLAGRAIRPLTAPEAASRDRAEIENLAKAGPIVMADYTIINETTLEELAKATGAVILSIRGTA